MLQVMLLPMLNIVSFCISGVLAEAHFMCSVKHGCFLQFLDFALFRYIAQVFSEQFFQMVPFAPVIIDMAFVFISHVFCVLIVSSLCFRILSFSLLIRVIFVTLFRTNHRVNFCYIYPWKKMRLMKREIGCLQTTKCPESLSKFAKRPVRKVKIHHV